jgi:hypothetical protein
MAGTVRGIPTSIPTGYILGRTSKGTGAVELIPFKASMPGAAVGGTISADAVSGLATVATSGVYADLTAKPTLDAWSSFTPNRVNWTDVGSPVVTGLKCQIRNIVYFQVKIVPATSTASVAGTSYIDLPATAAGLTGNGSMMNLSTLVGIGECVIDAANSRVYVPTQTATANTLTISGWFQV